MERRIELSQIEAYKVNLYEEEHSAATIRRYLKSIGTFYADLPTDKVVSKCRVLEWKEHLVQTFSASTVNVMLSAVNGFFAFMGWCDCKVKPVRIQKKAYRDREREMSRAEYERLLDAAKEHGNDRLYYLLQTLASTGIRISELQAITVEAVKKGQAVVDCKGKQRIVLIPKQLRRILLRYCKEHRLAMGAVFVTRSGKPINRSNVWKEMQSICACAGVDPRKVFPHNFRHLFAVMFYEIKKDIAKLADLLGHASIETTRIYIMETSEEHEKQLEKLGLIRPATE